VAPLTTLALRALKVQLPLEPVPDLTDVLPDELIALLKNSEAIDRGAHLSLSLLSPLFSPLSDACQMNHLCLFPFHPLNVAALAVHGRAGCDELLKLLVRPFSDSEWDVESQVVQSLLDVAKPLLHHGGAWQDRYVMCRVCL
jgi:hypothetical protein